MSMAAWIPAQAGMTGQVIKQSEGITFFDHF